VLVKDIGSNSQNAREDSRIAALIAWASTLLACAALLLLSPARAAETPDAQTLLKAPSDHQDWILPAPTDAGNRYDHAYADRHVTRDVRRATFAMPVVLATPLGVTPSLSVRGIVAERITVDDGQSHSRTVR
jgi:hypothetical protein